jgi:chromosomal replication initiation ATPase DnaA
MGQPPADDACNAHRQPRQLALDLAPVPGFDRENFLVSGSNARAYAMVEAWPGWPDPVLVLIGPPGAGKSHLGAIWAAEAGAHIVSATALAALDLDSLAAAPLLVEDLDRGGLSPTHLFHLLNLVREKGAGLLLTARRPPEAWGLALPDLVSRLRLAPRAELGPPDDALMRAVLVKLLVERQLVVDTCLVDYAALRLGRSLDAARQFIDAVDRRALSLKTRITRTLAAEVIGALAGDEETEERDGNT